jgi:hypothetical protein
MLPNTPMPIANDSGHNTASISVLSFVGTMVFALISLCLLLMFQSSQHNQQFTRLEKLQTQHQLDKLQTKVENLQTQWTQDQLDTLKRELANLQTKVEVDKLQTKVEVDKPHTIPNGVGGGARMGPKQNKKTLISADDTFKKEGEVVTVLVGEEELAFPVLRKPPLKFSWHVKMCVSLSSNNSDYLCHGRWIASGLKKWRFEKGEAGIRYFHCAGAIECTKKHPHWPSSGKTPQLTCFYPDCDEAVSLKQCGVRVDVNRQHVGGVSIVTVNGTHTHAETNQIHAFPDAVVTHLSASERTRKRADAKVLMDEFKLMPKTVLHDEQKPGNFMFIMLSEDMMDKIELSRERGSEYTGCGTDTTFKFALVEAHMLYLTTVVVMHETFDIVLLALHRHRRAQEYAVIYTRYIEHCGLGGGFTIDFDRAVILGIQIALVKTGMAHASCPHEVLLDMQKWTLQAIEEKLVNDKETRAIVVESCKGLVRGCEFHFLVNVHQYLRSCLPEREDVRAVFASVFRLMECCDKRRSKAQISDALTLMNAGADAFDNEVSTEECVYVCVCVRERECMNVCGCMCERERVCVFMCACACACV